MSKVVERVMANQLTRVPVCQQPATVLPVSLSQEAHNWNSDAARRLRQLMAADEREVTLLRMLDLSAASDCMEHTILLQHLWIGFGVTDIALHWIISFLTEWTHQIASESNQNLVH